MRLPRRVPWASLAELDEVCSWIYADSSDLDSKVLAINRLAAWKAITQLPHALEATHSLLVAIHQDNTAAQLTPRLSLRQSYSAALIRLVNGLVDPFQFGAYARSIASIASQLGLPPWLVELRHAATHEHLPSLDLLRTAARESMTWLLHNYFLPTLNSSTPSTLNKKPLRPLDPILKQYKNIMKIITRDASLKAQYQPAILSSLKDVERWISEAKVAAAAGSVAIDQQTEGTLEEDDHHEKWALECFSDGLLEKGALVPLSKRKRSGLPEAFLPPSASLLLWTPILQHVTALHPQFLLVLAGRIVSTLLSADDSDEAAPDPSYNACLSRWAFHINNVLEEQGSEDVPSDMAVALIQGLGHHSNHNVQGSGFRSAISLLEHLSIDPSLQSALDTLKAISLDSKSQSWETDNISVMESRLKLLQSLGPEPVSHHFENEATSAKDIGTESVMNQTYPLGWRQLDSRSTGWRPCPIGVFIPGS